MSRLLGLVLMVIIGACGQGQPGSDAADSPRTEPASAESPPAIAASAEETVPSAVGETAPRFNVRTVGGETFAFDPGSLDRPVVIISFRGGWCPYCNMHLSELRHVIPEIRASGVDVLFFSGDRPELLYESLKAETQDAIADRDYVILSDADAQAAIALGIAFRVAAGTIERRQELGDDIEASSMAQHGVLAVPSVFAIDRQGVIRFVHADPDFRVRLPADELLRVATELAGAPAGT